MSRKSRRGPQTRTMQKTPAMVPGARMAPVRSAQAERQADSARRSALSEALRHPTEQQPTGESKYTGERPVQPPDTIHDVDVGANWFGPMQPVAPYGPPSVTRPRDFDYTVGYNLNFIPEQFEFFQMLRAMRSSWGFLSAIIETRKDQLLTIPWTIQVRGKPKQESKWTKEIADFLKRPDGKHSFDQWMRMWMDDLFILDCPALYVGNRDRMGRPITAEIIDAATLFPMIDDAGRTPDAPQPAYQQIIKGLPIVNLDETELIRKPMRPLPYLPVFGYSPCAQILCEATAAVRKTFYEVKYWEDGTIPDMIMSVPAAWGVRQIAAFQAHFDAQNSGNLSRKSKVQFVPDGMKPFEIKSANGGEMYAPIDEMWIRLVCYVFSVPPSPFIRQMNRDTAVQAQDAAEQEGLRPLMKFVKEDLIDHLIQDRFGYDEVEMAWDQRPEVDPLKQAQVHQIQLNSGLRSRDECRADLGEEPLPDGQGVEPTVAAGGIVVTLESVLNPPTPPPAPVALPPGIPGGAPRGRDPKQVPAGGGAKGKPPARQRTPPAIAAKFIAKADTVSTGTGLVWYDQGDPVAKQHNPKTCGGRLVCGICRRKWAKKHGAVAKGHLANQIAREADKALPNPSPAQIDSGVYPKGHIAWNGLDLTIENASGRTRHVTDAEGVHHHVVMPAHYGYIRGTLGNDGMQVDCYMGVHPKSDRVWVIDQVHANTRHGHTAGQFDETKCMLGYKSEAEALADYLAGWDDPADGRAHFGGVTELSVAAFKEWLKTGDMAKPIGKLEPQARVA
jgi:hypothetical protein